MSTIHTPLTYNEINGKPFGPDYELAKQFADYLGVKLKVTVRQNISQLFDDLDNGNADLLAAGPVYNSERVKIISPLPIIPCHNNWFIKWVSIAHVHWAT